MVRKAFRPSVEESEREGWVGRHSVCSTDLKNIASIAKSSIRELVHFGCVYLH